jgi:hypothetical protein
VEDDAYWVNRTFQRFWMALGPARFNFSELGGVLRYLKMCAHSVLLDEVRGSGADRVEPLPDDEEGSAPLGGDVEGPTLDRLAAAELWKTVEQELPDGPMRLVVYLSFALGLKPGEIHDRYPEQYPTVGDVYRTKRNALDRLRRSEQVRAIVDGEPQNPPVLRSFRDK